MAGSSSQKQSQVFINFRGSDLRLNFLRCLRSALKNQNVNFYIDEKELRGNELTILFQRIEDSSIALAIFSQGYSESDWCLDELAKINECVNQGNLKVIPIFYRIGVDSVKNLTGNFGDEFRKLKRKFKQNEPERVQKWKDALQSIPGYFALSLRENSDISDEDFAEIIVKKVKEVLADISDRENTDEMRVEANTDCFTISAAKLEISHINKPDCWTLTTPNQEGIAIAKLIQVYWLHISGKFRTKKLIPGTTYEVVFQVKLDDTASGWRNQVNLELKLVMDDESVLSEDNQTLSLNNFRGDDWVDVKAGEFVAPARETPADISFTMYEKIFKDRKTGFEIKGVAIRPKE